MQPCSLLRRLMAIMYDLMLLASVLFLATVVILPVTGGAAIDSGNRLYPVYLLLCSYLYFAWQWVHGGRTLGMQAWRLRLVSVDAPAVTWKTASRRFLLACLSWLVLGAGFLWAIVERDHLTFHDRYSGTRLLRVYTRPRSGA